MTDWRSFIPYHGNKSVKNRVEELDENYLSLKVIFGTFFTKVPEKLAGGDIEMATVFAILSITTAILIIYLEPMKEKTEEAVEKLTT